MTPKELRNLHRLHCWKHAVQYDVILERIADGWLEKDIIQKSKRKSWIKYSNRINENLPRTKPPMRQHLIFHMRLWEHLFDYVEQDKEWLVKCMIRKDWKQIIECERIADFSRFKTMVSNWTLENKHCDHTTT